MTHNYPQPGSPTPRQDGFFAINYLKGFQTRLSNLLIKSNYAEIIELGAMIYEARAHRYWKQWPGQDPQFRSFGEWCWSVLHFRERKAEMLSKIYLDVRAMGLSEPTLYRALKIGWTKLSVVLRAARSEVSLIRWLDRIEEHNLTFDELRMEVSGQTPEGHRTVAGEVDAPTRSPKARSRTAKRERTDEGSDAYDAYDDDEAPPSSSVYPPEGKPAKAVRKTLVFDDEDSARVVFQAAQVMKDAAQGELGNTSALVLICANWMAHQDADVAATMGGQVIALEKLLHKLEVAFGFPIVIADGDGLLGRCYEMMASWGCEQHEDKRVKDLMRDLRKVLRR